MGVTLYVLSVSEISEKFMDFTFDMYFRYEEKECYMIINNTRSSSSCPRQFWKDGRLGFEIKVTNDNLL